MSGWAGAFSGYNAVEFWAKRNDVGTPDFSVQLSSKAKVSRRWMYFVHTRLAINSQLDWILTTLMTGAVCWCSEADGAAMVQQLLSSGCSGTMQMMLCQENIDGEKVFSLT